MQVTFVMYVGRRYPAGTMRVGTFQTPLQSIRIDMDWVFYGGVAVNLVPVCFLGVLLLN